MTMPMRCSVLTVSLAALSSMLQPANQMSASRLEPSATGVDCPQGIGELVYNAIVSDSGVRANSELFAVCVDGSAPRRLTRSTAYDGAPQWSPDGRLIAFLSDRDAGARQGGVPASYLYVMNADGTGVRRVIERYVGNFTWAPDGRRFAIISIPEISSADSADANRWSAQRDIFTVNLDGSGLTRLTNSPGAENFPAWSPDGREIVFSWRGRLGDRAEGLPARTPEEDWAELYVMNIDGTGAKRLTFNKLGVPNGCCEDAAPSWSPDSRWIAFISKRDANSEIYRMRRDGSDQQRLTRDTTFDGYPAWSADGRYLAFNKHIAARRDGAAGRMPDSLYLMNADGTERRPLGISGSRPVWRRP